MSYVYIISHPEDESGGAGVRLNKKEIRDEGNE